MSGSRGRVSGGTLAGLSVLVVRPLRSPDSFCVELADEGADVHPLPVMVVKPLPLTSALRDQLLALPSGDKVIAVSANAATLALRHLAALGVEDCRPVQWFAVGASSAEPLLDAGLSVSYPEDDPSSEGLLALSPLQEVAGQRIVILRGEGGKDVLRQGLERRGARVSYCEMYRREQTLDNQPDILRLLATGAVDVVVAHSAEVLRCFLALPGLATPPALSRLTALVTSVPAALMAQQAGFGRVVRADSAMPGSMVEALRCWYTQSDK